MKKRILAILLCACLLLSFASTAFAEEDDMTAVSAEQTAAAEAEQTAEAETEQTSDIETAEAEETTESESPVVIEETAGKEPEAEEEPKTVVSEVEEEMLTEQPAKETVQEAQEENGGILDEELAADGITDDTPTENTSPWVINEQGIITWIDPSNAGFTDKIISNLIIPDTVNDITVKGITAQAFLGLTMKDYTVKRVEFPDTITELSVNLMHNCARDLESVKLPAHLTSIGDFCFASCRKLTSIDIPDTVTHIGDKAFFACDSLTSITFPASLTTLADDAILGCANLKEVTFLGNAPSGGNTLANPESAAFFKLDITLPSDYVTIYTQGATGFTNPWRGYPTKVMTTDSDIVKGDLLGKGKPTLGSFSLLGQYLLKTKTLDDYQLKAADMNGDGKVSMADFALLGRTLLGVK